ncbi:hypothetical protein BH20ACI1_BH20ACI1_18280 [soil metagenome]
MNNLTEIKQRYLRDSIPVRLGGLAANLARVKSFSKNSANGQAVFNLFEESKFFIEWTADETEIETKIELVELQLQIALWQRQWQTIWDDETKRNDIAQTSAEWSKKVLKKSGLLSR